MKALILGAGLGLRLRPLTTKTPKPLVPFFGPSLLAYAVYKLKSAGIKDIALNVCHLPEAFKTELRSPFYAGLRLSIEPELYGTAGAINPLRSWLGPDPLLILNGDIFSDLDLGPLIETHQRLRPLATMALLSPKEEGKTALWQRGGYLEKIGNLSALSPDPMASVHSFACAHILSPDFIAQIPPNGSQEIMPIYQKFLDQSPHTIAASEHSARWFDLGNFRDLWRAHVWGFCHFNDFKTERESLLASLHLREPYVHLERKVISYESFPESELLKLENSIIFPGGTLSKVLVPKPLISGDDYTLNVD